MDVPWLIQAWEYTYAGQQSLRQVGRSVQQITSHARALVAQVIGIPGVNCQERGGVYLLFFCAPSTVLKELRCLAQPC